MRSRDLRPFTVEIKNKRRHPASAPASIWADTGALLKLASEPDAGNSGTAPQRVDMARDRAGAPVQSSPVRRVLPDLRAAPAEAEPGAEAGPAVPPPAPKIRRNAVRHDSGPLLDHGALHAAKASEPAPSVSLEPVRLPQAADVPHDAMFDGAVSTALGDDMAGDELIMMPAAGMQRTRKWTRRAGDLPRGERWKRRLPEVCR